MSPVSRVRKRKNTKGQTATQRDRQRGLFDIASPPPQACDSSTGRGDAVDPAQLIDGLLGDARALVAAEDPLDAEIAGAALVSMVALAAAQTGLVNQPLNHLLLDGFIPAFQARAGTEAIAMLLALGSIAPDPVGAAASAAAARLARAGVERPRWAKELAAPLTTSGCWRLSDPAGTGSIRGASFTRAGRSHAVLVGTDELDCGAATDIALLDADELTQALAILRSTRPDQIGPHSDVGKVIEETLDAAEWRWQVENALDAREVHDHDDADTLNIDALAADEEHDLPSYPALALLLRTRLRALPKSSKPKPPHGGHDEGLTVDLTTLAQTLEQLVSDAAGHGRTPISPRGQNRVAKLPAKRAKHDRPAPIYQIKAGVRDAKPPIWRRLQLPADTSLATLHNILQIAFDWDDYHMHLFHTPCGDFGAPDPELGHRTEAPVTLEQVAPTAGAKIRYTYDFGDDWNLDIVVEKLLEAEPTTGYPRCTGGRRAAPPEDSGGIWAYTNFTDALADPTHPDHDDALDWLGHTNPNPADFDPAHFDADAITQALSRLH